MNVINLEVALLDFHLVDFLRESAPWQEHGLTNAQLLKLDYG